VRFGADALQPFNVAFQVIRGHFSFSVEIFDANAES
jgi:hypothetical protein